MKEKWINILDRALEYSLYGIILFIPLSSAAIEIFFGFALLFFILKKILRPDFKFLKTPAHLFLFAFFAFSAASLVNSGHYFEISLRALFSKWGEYILIFIMIQDTLSTPRRIRNAVFIFLSMAMFVGFDAIFQRFQGVDLFRQRAIVEIKDGPRAITAAFKHYNSLGTYLTCILLLSLGGLISASAKRFHPARKGFSNGVQRIYLFFLIILSAGVLLLTFSRGSWLALFFGLCLAFILSREFKILYLFIFFAALLFLPSLRERLFYLFTQNFEFDGYSQRFGIWKVAFKMIGENPLLGKGVGTFMANFSQYSKGVAAPPGIFYAHNCFLQIWAETGVFALVSFFLFVGFSLYNGIKTFKHNRDFLLLGFICAVFAFLVHSFFDTQLYSLQLAVLFWSMIGLAAAQGKILNKGALGE